MGFLTGLINIATKVLPSIGTGVISGVKDFIGRMDDSLLPLDNSTSSKSFAVSADWYRKFYFNWKKDSMDSSKERSIKFNTSYSHPLQSTLIWQIQHGKFPMGIPPMSIFKFRDTGIKPIPLKIANTSGTKSSLFFLECRLTNI